MKRLIAVLFGIAAIIAIGVGIRLYRPTYTLVDAPSDAFVPYDVAWNFRQGINECGPYTAAAALRALGVDVASSDVVAQTPWRWENGYTIPWGLESVIRAYGKTVHAYTVRTFDDNNKLLAVRDELTAGHPVILLGDKTGFPHYYSVFGYADERFFVYDPLHAKGKDGMTVDDNGEAPGNRTLTSDELLEFWDAGGVAGFFRGYMLAVSN